MHCVTFSYLSILAFPTGRDSATFWDKGTEVPSLSRDKGTTGQAQNLTKGRDGSGQPVKIRDRTRDRTVQDFDSLSRPVENCVYEKIQHNSNSL